MYNKYYMNTWPADGKFTSVPWCSPSLVGSYWKYHTTPTPMEPHCKRQNKRHQFITAPIKCGWWRWLISSLGFQNLRGPSLSCWNSPRNLAFWGVNMADACNRLILLCCLMAVHPEGSLSFGIWPLGRPRKKVRSPDLGQLPQLEVTTSGMTGRARKGNHRQDKQANYTIELMFRKPGVWEKIWPSMVFEMIAMNNSVPNPAVERKFPQQSRWFKLHTCMAIFFASPFKRQHNPGSARMIVHVSHGYNMLQPLSNEMKRMTSSERRLNTTVVEILVRRSQNGHGSRNIRTKCSKMLR